MTRTKSSWKATLKALRDDGEGYMITPEQEGSDPVAGLIISEGTKQLLEEFDDICQLPTSLPPQRELDHAINLKEGFEIPDVRPYRYPYYQKMILKKL